MGLSFIVPVLLIGLPKYIQSEARIQNKLSLFFSIQKYTQILVFFKKWQLTLINSQI